MLDTGICRKKGPGRRYLGEISGMEGFREVGAIFPKGKQPQAREVP
jgi:hypothetical protein